MNYIINYYYGFFSTIFESVKLFRVGYDMLRGLGHSLINPLPSLFSFKVAVSYLQNKLVLEVIETCWKKTILFSFILFYFVLFRFILFYFVLFYFILFYFALFFYFVLFCFILFHFVLFCFILFYFVLFCFILFHFVLFFVLFYLFHCFIYCEVYNILFYFVLLLIFFISHFYDQNLCTVLTLQILPFSPCSSIRKNHYTNWQGYLSNTAPWSLLYRKSSPKVWLGSSSYRIVQC